MTTLPWPERFWNKVDYIPGHECWEWNASTDGNGYGKISIPGRKLKGAHIVSFWLTHGFWPNICRHKCDNPLCVRPEHLEDGTYADNTRDMLERGRARKRVPGSKRWKTEQRAGKCKWGHNEWRIETCKALSKGYRRRCVACRRGEK